MLVNRQNPTCRVHTLLDRMAGEKNQQTRKMFWGRGTKSCWEDNAAKIPTDIIKRLRARNYNQKTKKTTANEINLAIKTANMRNLLPGKTTQPKDKTDKLRTLTEKPHRIKDNRRENLITSKDNGFHFALFPNPEKISCSLAEWLSGRADGRDLSASPSDG